MKKLFILTIMALTGMVCLAQSNNNEDEVVKIDWYNQHATKEGELIVKFADNTTLQLQNDNRGMLQTTGINTVDALLQAYPVARVERLCPNDDPKRELKVSKSYNGPDVVERDLSRLCRFVMEDPMQTYEMMEALKELDEVEFAEPNYMAFALGGTNALNALNGLNAPNAAAPAPADGDPKPGSYHNTWAYTHSPLYSLQWGLQAVHLPELWAADQNNNNERAIIAILDTGVDIEHPDLAANIWTNPGETTNGYDDDNNGFRDDLHGWDFVNNTGDIHDWNSHGTHCAGIAAAVGDNGIGIAGANPKAYIMPIAVLQSNGTGDIATVIQGINYAKNNGADVLSMSFGSYSYSIAFEQALGQAYQNAVLVAAAGNDGTRLNSNCGDSKDPVGIMYPAAFTFVFGVEATQQVPGQCGYRTCWSNYDCDGPTFSQYGEEQLYNYELQAPGLGIYSTVPNGNYRNYSGTSMATPLVAGGISALLHAKPYASQEMLWGDLINTAGNHVNFKACYDADEAPAQLDFVCMEINDTIGGDGDYRPDAGETIDLYPTLRSTWGATNNIMMWLTVDEYEDPGIVTFLDTDPVSFGQSLSAYAKSKSANPLRFTIDPDCADGRIINLVLHLTANPTQYQLNVHFSITVENGVELGGMISDTVTLYPNVHYIVTGNLALTQNAMLIIKPGATLKFKEGVGLSNSGRVYAVGTPDSLITFTKADFVNQTGRMMFNVNDTLSYCSFENLFFPSGHSQGLVEGKCVGNGAGGYCNGQYFGFYNFTMFNNCIFRNNICTQLSRDVVFSYCQIYDNGLGNTNNLFNEINGLGVYGGRSYATSCDPKEWFHHNNIIGNSNDYAWTSTLGRLDDGNLIYFEMGVVKDNWFNNKWKTTLLNLQSESDAPIVRSIGSYLYMGSSNTSIVKSHIYDFDYPGCSSYAQVDVSQMAVIPDAQAHGVVWKVVVNSYDAQDEFEQLPPLGCGRHKFEVYFNCPMDTLITPMLTMGVRPPYTQHAIAEDGHWNADGTIYTAYLTINGTTATDGLNRIYVAGAKDTDHFEIPIENIRFNVQVASAGSLSNEFMATPGLGKVELEWNNNEEDFEDYLGYNMYRYTVVDTLGNHSDTLLLNTSLIQDTVFTDYNVEPGIRYYYYYKVLRTNLTEGAASLTVTTVPLTSIPGDANGSMAVDVADVVSLVSYLTNGNPQPFIFEAADVNSDGTIDILDIVGVINIITNRGGLPDKDPVATAYYSIDNGVLFVDTPVELGGVQFVFENIDSQSIETLKSLNGFENVKVDVSNGSMFLAYSMSGNKLPAGKHALLRIGDGTIASVALSDVTGHNVLAIESGAGVEENETLFMSQPYPNPFNGTLTIPYIIGNESVANVSFTIFNIVGQTVDHINLGTQSRGEYTYEWTPNNGMAAGIYTVLMEVNGRNVQHSKVVYVK
ncbi:MAG: S8 family serine peptidase [Bacteroidales bacterium]|nr:S8 family serine peptidase [Bacteroidales bacterium]